MIEAKNDIRVVGERAYIKLTGGEVAVIDAADVELVAPYRWHAKRDRNTAYAQTHVRRADGSWRLMRLHNLIANPPAGYVVDHVNADGVDNRRQNLNVVTPTANRQRRQDNRSGFVGVFWEKCRGKWRARIKVSGRNRHLGLFTDPIEAAKAYDDAALRYFPPGSLLNFPDAQPARAELDLAGGEQ